MPRKKQTAPVPMKEVPPVQDDHFDVKQASFFEGRLGFIWGIIFLLLIASGIFLFFAIADNMILSSFS